MSNHELEIRGRLLFSHYSTLFMRQQLQQLDFRGHGDGLESRHAIFLLLCVCWLCSSTTHPPMCVVGAGGKGGGGSEWRRVQAGEDVSSLTPILSLTWGCIESPCKAHVITPPPRHMCRARGESGGGGKGL